MKRFGATLLLGLAACAAHEEPDPKPVVAVKTAPAELADVALSVRAPASVHPRQQANIASRITAAIRELPVRKGDVVAAGQVLVRLETGDLDAQRADAVAALDRADVLAQRRAQLFEEGAIPQRDLLTAHTDLVQAKARLALIDAQLRFAELASPFAGSITEQFLYPGDMAQPTTPVFTVVDLSVAVARAQVPEPEAGAIRIGQAASFVPADGPERSFEGRITVVNRAVDAARRTVEVWCEIPNPRTQLLAGTFGELRVLTGTAPRSVMVPLAAVEFAEGTRKGSVLVVDAQNVAHRKEVTGGVAVDGKLQILEGLAAGERVVVEGGYGVPDGTAVRVGPEPAE